VVNGSDAPIEELDPLAGIRAGVRRTIDGRPAWHPEEALTVDEAFHATCVAPAWLARDERRRGTLLPGHQADLVVLDRDPWDDLDAEVVATMVGGRWVPNPPPGGGCAGALLVEDRALSVAGDAQVRQRVSPRRINR